VTPCSLAKLVVQRLELCLDISYGPAADLAAHPLAVGIGPERNDAAPPARAGLVLPAISALGAGP
jgi:hypothetical protein